MDKPDISLLLEKARLLLDVGPECLRTKDRPTEFWTENLAVKRINIGLLEVAAASRAERIAISSDDRRWAGEIRKSALANLEQAQAAMKVFMEASDAKRQRVPLSDRLFAGAALSDSYLLATRAIDQLKEADR